MHPKDLHAAYKSGKNVSLLMRDRGGQSSNTEEIIETSYDLQAGSYIEGLESSKRIRLGKLEYVDTLAEVLSDLASCSSLLEAGVGEATTLAFVIKALNERNLSPNTVHGFDISWSRTAYARSFLNQHDLASNTHLCVASLLHLPYQDSSFDIVYTSHSIEPNGGQEIPILSELYRVTSRYLVLLEPGYEIATPEAQKRMELHGYCRGLKEKAESLGYKVTAFRNFLEKPNPNNPTAITIIEKNPSASDALPSYACPIYKTSLERFEDCLYSEDSLRAYPILSGIPCLRRENAIIASKYLNFSG